ncbi:disulfide bond formation protein DsbA [Phenylobacterium sp. Root77]|jgi:2-hydroxychromene-2-carboxylate isomerase|uniref:2-hydroxychromene-2-carboxylate isomerase n=1 Tax=unclassified Phenylobacterium TaxID=2640670 RepID=UPI0006F5F74E|nr:MULTISPECIES: 2-hydroxychromene-2-carboxylate isomerase [unclassified Phenylobacterium]KQW71808.1 disulfide bond formation protein DsbA [Phenylobacterium sp. Root1277]KQW94728.1 disulfide bond formation protein DsbA [Phenylobacterium sp. Root1290]KRC44421.1 disulfide bond formation protein DsbA [Phenylobacterium sp. Root77]
MGKTVEFIFDFASPNAYLAHCVLPDIAQRTSAEIVITPSLLGGLFKITGNQAPMTAFGGIQGKLAYEALETKRFIAKHGLSQYQFNPHFPINTLLIMRGLVAARRMGVESPYTQAVFAGMWERGLKMDDPAVVASVLTEAGLDAKAILEATQDPEVKAELLANTESAAARGAFGIPTFFVGDEMFFGKERLGQVEEELAA